jgi:hypothetical protein
MGRITFCLRGFEAPGDTESPLAAFAGVFRLRNGSSLPCHHELAVGLTLTATAEALAGEVELDDEVGVVVVAWLGHCRGKVAGSGCGARS